MIYRFAAAIVILHRTGVELKPGKPVLKRFAVLLFLVFFPVFRAVAAPPVIVVEPFMDQLGYWFTHCSLSLQSRLSAELQRRYDCVLLGRNVGIALGVERTLPGMHARLNAMPEPEWRIGGANVSGKRLSSDVQEGNTELVVENLRTGEVHREVIVETAGNFDEPAVLAERIGELLKLAPRPEADGAARDRSGEVWAVLPIPIMTAVTEIDNPSDTSLSGMVECALLADGRLKALVERGIILRLLREQKLLSLGALDSGGAAGIGRLLGADRIVTGVVTAAPDGARRIDLLLVDCGSGIVSAAATEVVKPEFLEKSCGELALSLLAAGESAAVPVADTPCTAGREADRLLETIRAESSFIRYNTGLTAQIIMQAESYYLLKHEDDAAVLTLLELLYDRLLAGHCRADRCRWRECSYIVHPDLINDQQEEALYYFSSFALDSLRKPELYAKRIARLRFLFSLCAMHAAEAPERLAAWEKLDPSNKTIPRHRAKLAVLLGDPVKGAGLYLALGDETSAVLAYGIAGEERLAWETARQAKNFRALRNYHALLMFLALERKFASPRSALDWLDRIAAQAKPGERVHLDRTPAIRLHRALLYRETGRKAEALRILEKLRAEERKRSRSGGALYNRLYENDRKLLERTVAILRKSLSGRVRQEETGVKMAPVRQFLAVFPGRKIYLQPLGEIPAETLDSAAGLIRKKLGIDCVVRPALPLPLEESYDHGRHQFDCDRIPGAVRNAAGDYPEDAVLVLYLLTDSIYSGKSPSLRYVYYGCSREAGDCGVFSRSRGSVGFDADIARIAARLIFIFCAPESYCSNVPCIMTSLGCGNLRELDFVVCPQCEKKLRLLDPAESNRPRKEHRSPRASRTGAEQP